MSVCALGPSQRLVADLHNYTNYANYADNANYPMMMSHQPGVGSVTSWIQHPANFNRTVTSSRRRACPGTFVAPDVRNYGRRMNSGPKRLEEALVEAIPAASSARVSQRIAQLQQSLYSSCHSSGSSGSFGCTAPSFSCDASVSSGRNRPLSIDPEKDYSAPLMVDCSIEYDLPRVARPPPGAQPLLLIAHPALPVSIPSGSLAPSSSSSSSSWLRRTVSCISTQHYPNVFQNSAGITPEFAVPEFRNQQYPVSSSSSDSGRGTDCERSPGAIPQYRHRLPASGRMMTSSWNQMIQPALSQLKYIQQQQQHPRIPGQFPFSSLLPVNSGRPEGA